MLVNIREYYNQNGEMKPTKKVWGNLVPEPRAHLRIRVDHCCVKGISLTIEQYRQLLIAVPAINTDLRSKGINVEDLDLAEASAAMATKTKKPAKKSNIEATSEEESD